MWSTVSRRIQAQWAKAFRIDWNLRWHEMEIGHTYLCAIPMHLTNLSRYLRWQSRLINCKSTLEKNVKHCQFEASLLLEVAANSSRKIVSHAHLQRFKHSRDEKKMKREKWKCWQALFTAISCEGRSVHTRLCQLWLSFSFSEKSRKVPMDS